MKKLKAKKVKKMTFFIPPSVHFFVPWGNSEDVILRLRLPINRRKLRVTVEEAVTGTRP